MNHGAAADRPLAPSGAGVPVLRATVSRLDELAARVSTAVPHLVALTESDPALALNLFAVVNPRLRRSGRPPATQIQHALLVLGVPAFLERFRTAPTLEEDPHARAARIGLPILARGHHAACLAGAFAGLVPAASIATVTAAALSIHGLEYARALAGAGIDCAEPDRLENALPPLAREGDDNDAGRVCLTLGGRIALAVCESWDNEALAPLYADIGALVHRDGAEAERLVKLATVVAARAGRHIRTRPAAWNLLSPGPWPQTDVRPRAAEPTIRVSAKVAARAPDDGLDAALAGVRAAAAAGRSSTALFALALAAHCAHGGFRIALLLLRDAASGDFRIKLREGAALPAAYADLVASREANPLLEKLLRRERIARLDPARDAATLAQLEPALRRLIGRQEACVHSLVVDGRALGVVLACRPRASGGFEAFRCIAKALAAALSARQRRARELAAG